MRKFVITAASLLFASVACGQFKASQASPAGAQTAIAPPAAQSLDDAKRIKRDDAIKLVKEGKAIWVDVRPKTDYDAGHIKGAINIPLAEILTRVKELPPKKEIITYCA